MRGLCITVYDAPGWLAAGMSKQDILTDYPELELSRHPRLCCICRPIDTTWLDPGKSACNSGGRSRQVLVKQQFHAATRITCCSRSALESAGDKMLGRERRRRDRRLLSALRLNLDGPLLADT